MRNYPQGDSNNPAILHGKAEKLVGVAQNPAQLAADADLARVVEAWGELPEAIRRAVLALVQSAGS